MHLMFFMESAESWDAALTSFSAQGPPMLPEPEFDLFVPW